MKIQRTAALAVAILMLAAGTAGAEALSLNGTVEAGATVAVTAPIGGTVEAVLAEKGETVTAGQALVTLKTAKVYAPEDGTVTGVFGAPGEDAETVAANYGAVLYLEGTSLYTAAVSVSKAYSAVETMTVHAGETVYVRCRTATARTGEGVITVVDGSSYTVRINGGSFLPGDSVDVYRDAAFTDSQRIGRGSIERVSPTAVTATGAIVNICVKDGDTVRKGDLLLETLEGSFDAFAMTGTGMNAEQDMVIAAVSAETGGTVAKGDTVMQGYPISGMRIRALAEEEDRNRIRVGDEVRIELETDETKAYRGTVAFVSALPDEESTATAYPVYITFTPDEWITFGMSVIVTLPE